MNKYFAQLRPTERRLAFGVMVAFILVLNWLYVWPHFSDWSNWHRRFDNAQRKLKLYHSTILQKSNYEALVKGFESQGEFVAPADQAISFLRTIQAQANASHVNMASMSRQTTHTNDAFFVEQVQSINVKGTDQELVNFLYKLGSTASMIRVRDLEMQPDPPHTQINANIGLVASYQRKAVEAGESAHPKTSTAKAK